MARGQLRPAIVRLEAPAGDLLTLEQAAAVLQISPGTLKHWIHWRRIEHVKIGRLTRIRRAALDRYIQAQTVPAAAGE